MSNLDFGIWQVFAIRENIETPSRIRKFFRFCMPGKVFKLRCDPNAFRAFDYSKAKLPLQRIVWGALHIFGNSEKMVNERAFCLRQ
jgi:hypothetical protein